MFERFQQSEEYLMIDRSNLDDPASWKSVPDSEITILAEKVVSSYVQQEFMKSEGAVLREMGSNGCGCINCAKRVTKEANSWRRFMTTDPEKRNNILYSIESTPNGFKIKNNALSYGR
jgi:hypothetical protein